MNGIKKLVLIFGKHPELSLAEVLAVCGRDAVRRVSRECAIVESSEGFDADALQRQFGGMIKIGSVVEVVEAGQVAQVVETLLRRDQKMIFGMSVYGLDENVRVRPFREQMKRLGIDLKKKFREEGNRARFVVSKEETLSSVAVVKNKLLSDGVEVLLLLEKDRVFVGKTLTVQDFEEYNKRDYGRPRPSPRSGMLPPKVAQMMINLSGIKNDQTLLDPFCGSGTVLQEAMYAGVKSVFGSDQSAETVGDAKQNLAWFQKTFHIKSVSFNLFPADVRLISGKIKGGTIDVIVTEPYLGPPLTGHETVAELQKNTRDLESLYADAFREFARVVKSGGTVVMIFPRFQKGVRRFEIQILPQIQKQGFRVDPLIASVENLPPPLRPNPRGSVIYQREDQFVAREIFRFNRT